MTTEEGIGAGKAFSKAMGCRQKDMNDRLACLRDLEPSVIHSKQNALNPPFFPAALPPPYIGYAGTIDADYMPKGDIFLPDNPVKLMESGLAFTSFGFVIVRYWCHLLVHFFFL